MKDRQKRNRCPWRRALIATKFPGMSCGIPCWYVVLHPARGRNARHRPSGKTRVQGFLSLLWPQARPARAQKNQNACALVSELSLPEARSVARTAGAASTARAASRACWRRAMPRNPSRAVSSKFCRLTWAPMARWIDAAGQCRTAPFASRKGPFADFVGTPRTSGCRRPGPRASRPARAFGVGERASPGSHSRGLSRASVESGFGIYLPGETRFHPDGGSLA